MKRFLLTACVLLMSLPAYAEDWTKEEIAAGQKTYEMTRHVPAGKQRALDTFGYLNPDCTLVENTDTVLTKDAEHGSAVIEMVERYPSYLKDNVRSKCNDKKVKMPMVTYKAAVGYVGADTFEITSISANGLAVLYRYTIKITDINSKNKGRTDLRPF
jgi:hypothetical protein